MPSPFEMEEMYQLAAQAGFVPNSAEPFGMQAPVPESPGLLEGMEDSRYNTLLQGGLEMDPGLAQYAPSPVQAAPEGPGLLQGRVSTSEGQSRGAGVNVSGARFNEATAAKLDARTKGLEGKLRQAEEQVRQEFQPVLEAQTKAAESSANAVREQVTATIGKNEQEQRNALTLKAVNDELEGRVRNIYADNTARENVAKNEYLQRFRTFSQMQVDPQKFWKDSTVGQQLGSIAVAFVHDFLGAKGIKTSGMDSIKMAVERNIAAQVEAIRHGGQVAEGFRQIYEMERAQSQSEMETFDRLKPYFLESVKQKIIAETLPYESMLASANGKAALAKLDQELAKNLGDVFQHIAQNTNVRRQQEIGIEQEKARLAVEKWSVGVRAQEAQLHRDQFEAAKKAAQAQAVEKARGDYVIDPETNKAKWKFITDDETTRREIRKLIPATATANDSLNRLRQLAEKIGGGTIRDSIKTTQISKEDEREYNAVVTSLAHSLAQASDGRVTDQDVKDYVKTMPMATALTSGGVAHILAFAHGKALDQAYYRIQQVTEDVPENEQFTGPVGRPFETSKADAEARKAEHERGGKVTTQAEGAVKALEAGGYRAATDETFTNLGVDRDSEEMNWKVHGPKLAPKGSGVSAKSIAAGKLVPDIKSGEMPQYAVAVSALAAAAKGGKDPQAMDRLVKLATQDPRGGKYDAPEGIETLEDQVALMNWAQWKVFEITGQEVSSEVEQSGKRRPIRAGGGPEEHEQTGMERANEAEIGGKIYKFGRGVRRLRGSPE